MRIAVYVTGEADIDFSQTVTTIKTKIKWYNNLKPQSRHPRIWLVKGRIAYRFDVQLPQTVGSVY